MRKTRSGGREKYRKRLKKEVRDIDESTERARLLRDFSILTGYSGGIRVLVSVLHVLHQRLAAEEELVANWTAGCVRAADQGGVLLEHNTLLQLLF